MLKSLDGSVSEHMKNIIILV